jgi:hypothetical protein
MTPASDQVRFVTTDKRLRLHPIKFMSLRATSRSFRLEPHTKKKFDSGSMDEAGTATCQRELWGQRFDNNYSAQSLPCSETQLFGPEFTLIGDTLSMKELFESVGTLRIQGPTDAHGSAMAIDLPTYMAQRWRLQWIRHWLTVVQKLCSQSQKKKGTRRRGNDTTYQLFPFKLRVQPTLRVLTLLKQHTI